MNRFRYLNRGDGNGGQVHEHVLIARRVLGRHLPRGAEVHHVDGDGHNNAHANLIICPDHAYHKILHARTRAYEACGHASWMKCPFCKQYDDPKNMHVSVLKNRSPRAWHRECKNKWKSDRKKRV